MTQPAATSPSTGPVVRVRGAAQAAIASLRAARRRRAAQGSRRRGAVGLVLLLGLELGAFGWALSAVFTAASPGSALTLDELTALAKQGRVVSATLLDADDRLVGRFEQGPSPAPLATPKPATVAKPAAPATGPAAPKAQPSAVPSPAAQPLVGWERQGRFHVDYPASAPLTGELYRVLSASHARIDVDKQKSKQQLRVVTTFLLPLLVLATVFALLLAPGGRKNGGIGGIVDFSTVRGSRVKKGTSHVGFGSAGGVHEAVVELQEVVDYLRDPAKYEALGAAPPKGLLLFGPPGCGKTLLAKAVAGEAGVPFFSVAGAEFVEALVGVGAARVRDLFSRVRAAAPAIVFIDELDAAGRKRGAGGSSGGSDEREQTLNQLLVEMDGFDASKGIVVIGATNRPDILDPALRRPGRFDRHITIDRPDPAGRLEILQIHAEGKPLSPDVDLARIAARTPGFTGADLANVINEAALLAIREERAELSALDVDEAIRRVLEGPKRRGHLMSEAEKDRAAHHEAGHVVAAVALGEQRPQRVSVLGGGKAIATTELREEDEALVLTEQQLRSRLVVRLAGPAAERLTYGGISTGVERDYEQATSMARDMVARWGMAPGLAHARLLGPDSAAFLGDDTPWGDIAEQTKAAADEAIRGLLEEAADHALLLLERHRAAYEQVAVALREHETLEGEALEKLLERTRAALANGHSTRPRTRRTARV
jgi:cell division protease FtsH